MLARIAGATTYAEIADVIEAIASELRADEIIFSEIAGPERIMIGAAGPQTFGERYRISDFPATEHVLTRHEPVQTFEGDPDADAAELALMREQGYRSLLMLPVVCGGEAIGLLEALNREGRPWSRFELSRGRIIALQLGAALERLQRGDAHAPGLSVVNW